jgi:hypothetical protein
MAAAANGSTPTSVGRRSSGPQSVQAIADWQTGVRAATVSSSNGELYSIRRDALLTVGKPSRRGLIDQTWRTPKVFLCVRTNRSARWERFVRGETNEIQFGLIGAGVSTSAHDGAKGLFNQAAGLKMTRWWTSWRRASFQNA